ncbi:MAG: radical SAM protein [Candidatus Woesearchaeota archaeon]
MKELTIEITNRCRLNCLHCSTDAKDKGDIFFSLDEVTGYLSRFDDFDRVRLSGGEPFEHPQLTEIASMIKDQGREVYVLTCGVLSSGLISRSKFSQIKPFVDEVVFSVQGDWDAHDYIVTGDKNFISHPAYWEGVVDSADNAVLAGVDLSFHTVAMKSNYDSLEEIAKLVGLFSASRKKITQWHVLRFIKQGRGSRTAIRHSQQNGLRVSLLC